MARHLIVTCMKNEGPFILEWVAHHLAVGFDHFLVFTNDCDDGTDAILDTLMGAGLVTRLDNPYESMGGGLNPQKGALKYAESLDLVQRADWVLIADVDEFVNIHTGDGTLSALFAAVPQAQLFALQWRLFGNNGLTGYADTLITSCHLACAPRYCPVPHQAWGIKTLFSTKGPGIAGDYGRLGVHRPLKRLTATMPVFVNGSGQPLPEAYADEGWRLGIRDHGYDLVTLNHYAVRNCESFLVKRDRGRVNHVERDQGLAYWMRMNINMETDRSILARLPATRAALARLHGIAGITGQHLAAVAAHRAKIASLRARADMAAFFAEISSDKMAVIARHLNQFDRATLETGPDQIPDALIAMLAKVPPL